MYWKETRSSLSSSQKLPHGHLSTEDFPHEESHLPIIPRTFALAFFKSSTSVAASL